MASEVESVPPIKDEKENSGAESTRNEDSGDKQQEEVARVVEQQSTNSQPAADVVESTDEKNVGGQGDDVNNVGGNETAAAAAVSTVSMLGNIEGIPKELLVKHPLQYRWVLWYCKQDRSKEWEECLKEVASFDTVEDFWALYNHIQLASGLSWGSDYYLFKEGIRPMWEDTQNVEGGRWLIQVDKSRRNELLDHYWLELLMAVIGEQFDDYGEYICGLVINVRQKGDKVSLWTRDATKEDINRRIGQVAKQKLSIMDMINYEQHKDTSHKSSSMVKARLRV